MAIKISGTTVIDDNRNISAGIITATTLNVPPTISTFSPSNGSTAQLTNGNIVLTFSQTVIKGTGNIEIRSGSVSGTLLETIDIASNKVSISQGTVTINPENNLPASTIIYVVIPAGSFINALGAQFGGVSNYSFTTGLLISTFNPSNINYFSDSSVGGIAGISSNITLTFSSSPTRGTGTINLRSGSSTGTIVESYDAASSNRISIASSSYTIDPTNNLSAGTVYFLEIPNGAITNYAGLNVSGSEQDYSFETAPSGLGQDYRGGRLICASGGVRWIVAPASSEVSRNWYTRNDSNTRAGVVSGVPFYMWFVPSCDQLSNPGYQCKTYWEGLSCGNYWSSTQCETNNAWHAPLCLNFFQLSRSTKGNIYCVRSFRCVTY